MDSHDRVMQDPTIAEILAVPDHEEAKYASSAANRLRRSFRARREPDYYQRPTGTGKVTATISDRTITRGGGVAKGTTASSNRHVAHSRASGRTPALAKVASGGVAKSTQVSRKGRTSKGRASKGRASRGRARQSAGRLNTPPDSPESERREGTLRQLAEPSSSVSQPSSSSNTGQDSGSGYRESDVQESSTRDTQLSENVHAPELAAEDQHALTLETEHDSTDAINNLSSIEAEVGSLTVTDQAMMPLNGNADHDGTSVMDVDHVSPQVQDGASSAVKVETSDIDNITMSMAETMTVPSPGGKLVAVVEIAKGDGLLRDEYDSAVVRRVNGKFLVPQKCDGCVAANEFCDRSEHCQTCVTKCLSCTRNPAGFMVLATVKTRFECTKPDHRQRNHSAMNVVPIARPEPVGQPKVWAETRTALCETLPYFRAFQSAAYLQNGLCLALLVDRQGSDRDAITDNVVITRCGGGMSRVDGEMTQTSDQSGENVVVKAVTQNQKQKLPLVLIVGSGNANCPSMVPHRYCVMDFFHVTKIWCEKAGGKDCFMFRFERVLQEVQSWWSPSGQLAPATPPADSETPVYATCAYCERAEEQIYTTGWMCLNEKCNAFWTIDLKPPRLPLRHTSYFLNHRVGFNWRNTQPPCQLAPDLVKPIGSRSFAVGRHCWKGIVCQWCGACIPRIYWHEWRCETPGCGFRYTIPFTPLQVPEVSDPHGIPLRGHAAPTTKFLDPITVTHRFTNNYRINTYTIPGCGTVTHFQANLNINEQTGGPNDMFLALQQVDLGLKRFPMSNSQLPGALTAHFAVNYGMPYKYVVAVDSKSFREAPREVLRALHRLTWAGEQCVTDGSFRKFNELLTVGYFQEQKMGYHDDGERTLGPTIASLSLGAEATMSFRMKKTHWSGFSKSGVYQHDEEPLPGCRLYEERKELYNLRDNRDDQTQRRRHQLMREISRNHSGYAPSVIKTVLKHGDLLVMHGANIQKYYEHSVQNSGKLRFALTCRYVRPELIPEDQHDKGDYVRDNDYLYNGDEGVNMSADNGLEWGSAWVPHSMGPTDGLPVPTLLPIVNAPVVEEPQFRSPTRNDSYNGWTD